MVVSTLIIISLSNGHCAKREVVLSFLFSIRLSESTKPEVKDAWEAEHLLLSMSLGEVLMHY